MAKLITQPNPLHYAIYYQAYVDAVDKRIPILKQLKQQMLAVQLFYANTDEQLLSTTINEHQWNYKVLLQHLIDYEKLFVARALHFLRGNTEPQYWINENDFAQSTLNRKLTTKALLAEYVAQRKSTLVFYKNISTKEMKLHGIATNYPMSVLATIFIITGYEKIILHKYFKNNNTATII